ncbi:MAG TPA: ABC transporter permease, partial [Chitinophagaceae bacterium]
MVRPYSQRRALLAITKASFKSIFKSPSSTFFSLFFPIVLIVIFGSLGRGGGVSFDVALDPAGDSTSVMYEVIKTAPIFHVVKGTENEIRDQLRKGRITAILNVRKTDSSKYDVHIISSSASQRELPQLQAVLNGIINEISQQARPIDRVATLSNEQVPGRIYRTIDFY